MTRITWGSPGTSIYEAGVDRGVFYPNVGPGLAWNGLVSVTEDTVDRTEVMGYVDGQAFRAGGSAGTFEATIRAFTYPDEFEQYNEKFSPKRRVPFGLSYRTLIGSDISELGSRYQLHLVYNAIAGPTSVEYSSISTDSVDPAIFEWTLSTRPVKIPGMRPSSHFVIDSSLSVPEALAELEAILYGTEDTVPRMPTIEELLDIFERNAILIITNHGDGTWTASGPDNVVYFTDPTTFVIDWPSVVYLDEDTYRVSSM